MRIERRCLRDQMNPFEAPDSEFMNNFRLSKELTQNLIEWLRPYTFQAASDQPAYHFF
jgi:hypothetical protein